MAVLVKRKHGYSNEYDLLLNAVYEDIHQSSCTTAINRLLLRSSWRLKPIARECGNHSWYVVGVCFSNAGKHRSALRAFRNAARSWPEDGQAHAAIGNCYSELGRPKLAERHFRRSLMLDSKNKSVKYNLANALFDQMEFEAAIPIYRSVERSIAEAKTNRLLAQHNLALKRSK
jgi:tetratricopeptide (TPR) repeat protein